MSTINEKRRVVELFFRGIDQSSFVLKKNPELIFPQVYNRLQVKTETEDLIKKKLEYAQKYYKKPWLRLLRKVGKDITAIIRTFTGHTRLVTNSAFSPNGRLIVSASTDDTLKLWDVETGQELATLKGHTNGVTCCNFSPDGSMIVSGSWDNTLKLWDVKNFKEISTLKGHKDRVQTCTFSPKGQLIISGSNDKTIKLWDVKNQKEITTLKGHRGTIYSCAFSPDGQLIVSGSDDGALKLWDVKSREEIATFEGHEGAIYSCSFSPDGRLIISGSSDWESNPKALKLWNVIGREKIMEISTEHYHPGGVLDCAFSPDGKYIFSSGGERLDKNIIVFHADTGKKLAKLSGHSYGVISFDFSPDSKYIISGSLDKTLKLWDYENIILSKSEEAEILKFDVSPDGKKMLISKRDRTLKLYATGTGEEITSLEDNIASIIDCAFSPDGKRAVFISQDYKATVWDTETVEKMTTFKSGGKHIDFSPDGKRIIQIILFDFIKIWSNTGKELFLLKHDNPVSTYSFSPNCKYIVSGTSYGELYLWDTDTGELLDRIKGHKGEVKKSFFSPDCSRIISYSTNNNPDDRIYILWDTEKWKLITTFKGHSSTKATDSLYSCVFSPDGKRIATSFDNTVELREAGSGNKLITLEGHNDLVHRCNFSPEGNKLITASEDRTLKLWNAESGKELFTLRGHTNCVAGAFFSYDGKKIVSISWDDTLRLWDTESGTEQASLKGLTGRPYSTYPLSPDGKRIVVGDDWGQILLLGIENLKTSPAIATAYTQSGNLFFKCPYCLKINQIENPRLGQEITCPMCIQKLKLNPFSIESSRIKIKPKVMDKPIKPLPDVSSIEIEDTLEMINTIQGVPKEKETKDSVRPENYSLSKDSDKSVKKVQNDVPLIQLAHIDIPMEVIELVPLKYAQKYMFIPFSKDKNTICVAMVDPIDDMAIDEIRFSTGLYVKPFRDSKKNIMNAIEKYYSVIRIHPAIVTSNRKSGQLFYICKYCQKTNQIEDSSLGQEVTCSSCEKTVKLNLTVKLD